MTAAPLSAPATRRWRPRRPTDLRATLGVLWRGPKDPATRLGDGEVWRATRTPDGPGTLRLRHDGDALAAEAWGAGAEWLLEHAPSMCGEGDDDSGFVPCHPLVAELARRRPGLRICRTEAVTEAALVVVLEQKVTSSEACRSWARLVGRLGEPAPGPGGMRLPPQPARVAATPWWEFHPIGVERRRAETLRRVGAVSSRLEETVAMTRGAARERLLAVPGLGPWTAACVALAALGDADAVPVGDYHIPSLVSWALAGEPRGTDERMLELLEPYAGHRGRVVRLLVTSGVHAPRRGPRMPDRDLARM